MQLTTIRSRFRHEFDAEIGSLVERRFKWWIFIWLLSWLPFAAGSPLEFILSAILICVGGWFGIKRLQEPEDLLRLAMWLIMGVSAISLLLAFGGHSSPSKALLFSGFCFLVASILLPMSSGQAARLGLGISLIWLVGTIWTSTNSFKQMVIYVPFHWIALSSPMWLGIGIIAFRSSRFSRAFDSRMLRQHHDDYSREVFDARKFHEAIFPRPVLDGPIQFTYLDLPRAGIGGDFLHTNFDAKGTLTLVLLDVSGDGISAALTVHRLQGELERVIAESESRALTLDEMHQSLDRYVQLTLAGLGIYAFAMFVRIDPTGALQWTGAGHTPSFIRKADGSIERLESTTWPLGASLTKDPKQCVLSTTMMPGDTLLVHTDGACEEMNAKGERLGFKGMEQLVHESQMPTESLDWPHQLVRDLEAFRGTDESLMAIRREDMLLAVVRLDAGEERAT